MTAAAGSAAEDSGVTTVVCESMEGVTPASFEAVPLGGKEGSAFGFFGFTGAPDCLSGVGEEAEDPPDDDSGEGVAGAGDDGSGGDFAESWFLFSVTMYAGII